MKSIGAKYRIIAVIVSLCVCIAGCSYVKSPVSVSVTATPGGADAETAAAPAEETETKTETEAESEAEPEADAGSEPETEVETEGTQLIPEGSFTEGADLWGLYQESGGSAALGISGGELVVLISNPGRVGHSVQLYRDGFELLEGAKYHFSVDISSDVARTIEWRIQLNGGDYHPYTDMQDIAIGPQTATISCDFTMEEPSDPAPRMCFNLGDADSKQHLGAHEIHLENVSLVLTNDAGAEKIEMKGEMMDINVDQRGYRPNDEKLAVIKVVPDSDDSFEVIDCDTGEKVYSGKVTEGNTGGTSGDHVMYADFSEVKKPGRYMIKTAASGSSAEFEISSDIYDAPLRDAQRMLFLQRCGMQLTKELAGDFAHSACHTQEAAIYGGEGTAEVSGGWHDAGDYGRYTVPAAKAVADLMLAYEMYGPCFGDDNDIPESGNGIPDILDEVRYELEWMQKMQRDDGMVYHKVTGLNFDGVCMPDECTEELYVLPVSKTATADLAAAMYMASRIYKDYDAGFSKKCLAAADAALNAYTEHIKERNYTNPKEVMTGEYADGNSADELLWAVCEGYKTTGDTRFEKMLGLVDMERIEDIAFDWANVSGYGIYAYLTSENPMKSEADLSQMFYAKCDELAVNSLNTEAYGCTITDDYHWGSNMTVANNGMALLMGYALSGRNDYLVAAGRQLHYLFGTNANSYCFLTGYGTQCPNDPHHRPSQALNECMKGMLVGGPNSDLEDPYAKAVLGGLPKARCYVDSSQSYSCNEVTIYWNSPLCFLMAGITSAPGMVNE